MMKLAALTLSMMLGVDCQISSFRPTSTFQSRPSFTGAATVRPSFTGSTSSAITVRNNVGQSSAVTVRNNVQRPSTSASGKQKKKRRNLVKTKKTVGLTPAHVFNQNVIRKYNIMIHQADLLTLNSDPSAEEYVACNITTGYQERGGGKTFLGAGCRYKGSKGSLLRCIDQYTGEKMRECRKFSLKVDANKWRDDKQRLDGLKRLNFHAMSFDKALVSERLSYNAMRDLGIPSPRASHAEVYINGVFDGLYSLVQEPSSALTKEHFADDETKGKNAIYKDFWFREDQLSDEWLDAHIKAGKKQHKFLREVTYAINDAPDRTACNTLEKYFDTESIVNVTAFNEVIGQYDDWRFRHNFFWYVRADPDGQKLVMVPWDYDRLDDSPGPMMFRRRRAHSWTNEADPSSSQCTDYQISEPFTEKDLATSFGFRKTFVERWIAAGAPESDKPIECDKITRVFAQCLLDDVKARFQEYSNVLTSRMLERRIDKYVEQLRPVVQKDSTLNEATWPSGVKSLKKFVENARTSAKYLGATSTSGSSGSITSPDQTATNRRKNNPPPSFTSPQTQTASTVPSRPTFGGSSTSSSPIFSSSASSRPSFTSGSSQPTFTSGSSRPTFTSSSSQPTFTSASSQRTFTSASSQPTRPSFTSTSSSNPFATSTSTRASTSTSFAGSNRFTTSGPIVVGGRVING